MNYFVGSLLEARNLRKTILLCLCLTSPLWAEMEEEQVEETKVEDIQVKETKADSPQVEEKNDKAEEIAAEEVKAESTDDTRLSLEHELQNIKKDILKINRDLFILEEDLLFPSNTQTKVFLSIDVGQYFKLDSVTLKMNDKPVANHLYTDRELIALSRGAIQRLHTENLASGEHEVVAVIVGTGPEGRDYRRAVSTKFEKKTGPKYLQLIISGDRVKQQPEFAFKDWE